MEKVLFILFFIPLLVFSQKDLKYYEEYMPESSCGEIIHYNHFSASFCEKYGLSEWTIYYLTKERLEEYPVRRTDNFRQDPQLNGRDANLDNYRGSGYDRGHLVPAGDMTFDSIAMSESFFSTNFCAMHPSFNRGCWKKLESQIRDWVHEFDNIAIITGWVQKEKYIVDYIGGETPVPSHYYKVFIDINRKTAIALIIPNNKCENALIEYAVSIDSLETITGLDFFYKLSEDDEFIFEIDTGINKRK